jgi:hypothetical protein
MSYNIKESTVKVRLQTEIFFGLVYFVKLSSAQCRTCLEASNGKVLTGVLFFMDTVKMRNFQD